jgi:hypothetical protein
MGERGIPAMGVDLDPRWLRVAEHAAERAGIKNVAFCRLEVDIDTIALLPHVDAVILLSVWHHWVWSFGLDGATELLAALWDRAGKVMFFETGEAEMPPEFGLPAMGDRPEGWLADYLTATCASSTVTTLGTFKAFGVEGNETRNVAYRNLFAVTRNV